MSRVFVSLAVAVVLLLVVHYPASTAEPKAPASWEYRIMTSDDLAKAGGDAKDLAARLNKVGSQGWELSAADGLSAEAQLERTTDPVEAARLSQLGPAVFIFKRAK